MTITKFNMILAGTLLYDVPIVDICPLNATHITVAAAWCVLIFDISHRALYVRMDGCTNHHGRGIYRCESRYFPPTAEIQPQKVAVMVMLPK